MASKLFLSTYSNLRRRGLAEINSSQDMSIGSVQPMTGDMPTMRTGFFEADALFMFSCLIAKIDRKSRARSLRGKLALTPRPKTIIAQAPRPGSKGPLLPRGSNVAKRVDNIARMGIEVQRLAPQAKLREIQNSVSRDRGPIQPRSPPLLAPQYCRAGGPILLKMPGS
ncbi:uncharacterized protein BDZ99DRAFT_457277 [Mytilinidion resinicola]|uniref:Uncharacterized protein n=1 Tax=Mytilinidion resinicola TaxID=574789 RepID=A0A6A6ZB70_9PEZI|nr:uncharacterized protein BDZ99DRAFT_457277 [Mytilinidion resinicola]KAF2817555.1 hypothetical protein BDZ99DRAFT_457277 [Mytilinidion resinicola]